MFGPELKARRGNYGHPGGRPMGCKDGPGLVRVRRKGPRKEWHERVVADVVDLLIAAPGTAFEGDAHAVLVVAYKNPALDNELRVTAARSAIKFEKPALSATQISGEIELRVGRADRLDAALDRARKLAIVIEGGPVEPRLGGILIPERNATDTGPES